ncbi:MAG TPA: PAS domain S-box protein [Lentimicrobium sp.]|nr:PAS domain S-box protein [Lentimicrobium sp.]
MKSIYKFKDNIVVAAFGISLIFLIILIHSYFLFDNEYNLYAVIGLGLLFLLTFGRNRRKMYLRLKEHERQLASMVRNLPGCVYRCLYDEHWTITYVSHMCQQITGYTPDDFINNRVTYAEIISVDFRELVDIETEKAIKEKRPFSIEYQIVTSSKQLKWVMERGTGVYDAKGNLMFLEGYIEDISERKEQELEIIERNEDYSRLLNGMNETVWLIDFKGNLVDVNRAATETLGYTSEELLSIGLEGIDNSFRQAEFSNQLTYINDEINSVFETTHRAKDGRLIPVEICSSIVRYKGCRVILGIARDITARKQLEEQRKFNERVQKELLDTTLAAKHKAEESERLKMAFLANMSHEIRTPMNGILGFMELLKEPDLEENSRQEYIKLVNQSGQRLLTTINDIIEISKIETGEHDVKLEALDLREIMQFYYNFFKPETDVKGLKLIMNQQIVNDDARILSDKHKLDSILTNLIKNAIKFTVNGYIEIGSYISDDSIIFFVKDTGRGIPRDHQFAVFERFVQADNNSPVRKHEGSGLGLTIAKAYVESLKGRIWVVSEPGKGSDFRFMIPYLPVMNTPDQKPIIQNTIYNSKPLDISVLIAEDDDISYRLVKFILSKESIEVTRAHDGVEAVELARSKKFDLILMDVNMPLLDGLDATRLIREFDSDIPIIAQTAYALEGDREKTSKAGCNGYLSKPVKKEELLKMIYEYSTMSKK